MGNLRNDIMITNKNNFTIIYKIFYFHNFFGFDNFLIWIFTGITARDLKNIQL